MRIISGAISALVFMFTAPGLGAETTPAKDVYRMYCTQCHGLTGDGKGINAASMSVQPRAHIEKEEMSLRSDEELFKTIEQGGPAINKSVLMPAWKDNLSSEEIQALVKYLRELCCSE
ncbi:c-type cytochrome [Gilvimarinus sp. F26214L]|uniref:c-type cytochrome n=1 Tax=Gilvimarinus sp. DZF01 TaxID=3461371 RepID=UPI00404681D9